MGNRLRNNKRSRYKNTHQVASILGIKPSDVRILCRKGYFKDAFQGRFSRKWFIPIKNVKRNPNDLADLNNTHQLILSDQKNSPFSEKPLVIIIPIFLASCTLLISLCAIVSYVADFAGFRKQVYEWNWVCATGKTDDNTTLILISTFYPPETSIEDLPHQQIYMAIKDQLSEMNITNVDVKIHPVSVNFGDLERIKEIGNRCNATLVIWGQISKPRILVNFYNLKHPEYMASNVEIDEIEKTVYRDPKKFSQFITTELPNHLAFLSLFAIGQTVYNDERYKESIDIAEQGINSLGSEKDTFIGLGEAYKFLSIAYDDINEIEKCLIYINKAIEINSNDPEAYRLRGVFYAKQDKSEMALEDLNKAIELAPYYDFAYDNRGALYFDTGKLDLALSDISMAISLDPDFGRYYYNRAHVNIELGNAQDAICDFTQAILFETDIQCLSCAYFKRGLLLYSDGRINDAKKDFNKSIYVSDTPSCMANMIGTNLLNDYRDFELSKYYFNKMRKLLSKETSPSNYQLLIQAQIQLNDMDTALEITNDYVKDYPDDLNSFITRGSIYHNMGNFEKAFEDLSNVLLKDPTNISARATMGAIYLDRGDREGILKSLDYFNQVIMFDKYYLYSYYGKTIAYEKLGDIDKSIDIYNEIEKLEYSKLNPSGIYWGWLGIINGELDNRREFYTNLNYERAYNHHRLCQIEEAIRNYKLVLEIAPTLVQRSLVVQRLSELENGYCSFKQP